MKHIDVTERLRGLHWSAPDILADYAAAGPAMVGLVVIAAGSTDHFWERHGGGDELLFVFEGRARFTAISALGASDEAEVGPGDLLLLERDEVHRAQVKQDLRLLS